MSETDDASRNCILVVAGANGGLSPQDVRDAAAATATNSAEIH